MRNILVAMDGSEGADRAVDVAAEIARAVGGNLSSVTVGGNLSREEISRLAAAEKDVWEAVDTFSNQISSAPRSARSAWRCNCCPVTEASPVQKAEAPAAPASELTLP
jgi:nucleotide-binding universal stress UspA family protein